MGGKNIVLISLAVLLAVILIMREFAFSSTIAKKEADSMVVPQQKTELTLPKPDEVNEKIKVNTKGAVTFLLSKNDNIFFYEGKFNDTLNKTDYKNVGKVIKNYLEKINKEDLIFFIKAETSSTFKNAIDLLDEMVINKVPAGHYAEVEITDAEINSINKYNNK